MSRSKGRRPLKVRDAVAAQRFARWLSRRRVTPNQISIVSVFFASGAAACLLLMPRVAGQPGENFWSCLLPLIAAAMIQCRLLCNLFDGMVAVEGGKGTRSGELFNDIPDRIADPLILVAAGYATEVVSWSEPLGWAAGLGAVMTAYVRTLASSLGAPNDFRGPMAKQHRMALMTLACVLMAATPFFPPCRWSIVIALLIIVVGCAVTCVCRANAAYQALESTEEA
ncbi:MAG: CDP-alcohol phosphatidyltransferase family protein [Rubripirellula sp.]